MNEIDNVQFFTEDIFDLKLDIKPDITITSPPYWGMDSYRYGGDPEKQINFTHNKKEFIQLLTEATKKIYELMNENGTLLINVGLVEDVPFRYISEVLDNTKFKLIQTLIWDISETLPETESLLGTAQPWFLLSKTEKPCINPFYVKKHIGSVLRFPAGNHYVHNDDELKKIGFSEDAFPIELIDFFINAFSKPRQTVLDPFGGSGVAAVAALKNNRKAIINDISKEQILMAQKRIELYLQNGVS